MSTFNVIFGIASITLVAAIVLKQYKPEFSLTIVLVGCALLLLLVLSKLGGVFEELKGLLNEFSISAEVFGITLKALGICTIAEFASNVSRDFGFTALAGNIELGCKILVCILALPIIKEVVSVAVELIK